MSGASRAALPLAFLIAALAGCRSSESARPAAPPSATQDDQQILGRELFELIDRAADFHSSHRGRYPASVAQMGVDSLTATTVRRLSGGAGPLTVTVAFRRPAGHVLASCSGGADALDGAALSEGKFAATCITPEGDVEPLQLDAGRR
jgi:hypothetical protein